MARRPTIWFRKDRKVYMTTINGRRINLGKDKKAATKRFHALMGADEVVEDSDSVISVLDDFLVWTYENRAERTGDGYKYFCADFVTEYGKVTATELTTADVTRWLSGKKTWNATTKHNAITALQRGFNWAVKNRGLRFNPIKGMEKPKPNRRTTVLSQDEFDVLINHISVDDPFRDLLIICWDCGCRPQEVKPLEAHQIDFENSRAIIKAEEGAKGGFVRAFYIPTPRSLKIIKKYVKENPSGPIFRNTIGNPWTSYAIKCRFEKLESKVGQRYHQYAFRHSYITENLRAGVDSHVVAALSGHKNTAMIDSVYSHIADDPEFMLKQAQKRKVQTTKPKKKTPSPK